MNGIVLLLLIICFLLTSNVNAKTEIPLLNFISEGSSIESGILDVPSNIGHKILDISVNGASMDAPFINIAENANIAHLGKIEVATDAMHKMLTTDTIFAMKAGFIAVKAGREIYPTYMNGNYRDVVIKTIFAGAKVYVPSVAGGMCGAAPALVGQPWLSFSAGVLYGTGASIATDYAEGVVINLIGN